METQFSHYKPIGHCLNAQRSDMVLVTYKYAKRQIIKAEKN